MSGDLRDLGRDQRSAEGNADALRRFTEQLRDIPWLDGQLVSGSIPAGGGVAMVRHSLGRAYRGGWVTRLESGGYADILQVVEARVASTLYGAKPLTEVMVIIGATSPNDTIFQLWVF